MLNILLMSNSDFSLYIFKELLKNKYNIVGLVMCSNNIGITRKKKKKKKIEELANNNRIPILYVNNLSDNILYNKIIYYKIDIIISASFKYIPLYICKLSKIVSFNVHPSLLPEYKGAAPINWVIINGEKKTGVTIHRINEKLDSGDVLLQYIVKIKKEYDYNKLYFILQKLSGKIVKDILYKINNNINLLINKKKLKEKKKYKLAPKISYSMCKINWKNKIDKINNLIKGLSNYSTAWSYLYIKKKKIKKIIKIFKVDILYKLHSYKYGKLYIKNNKIFVFVNGGILDLLEIQINCKKKMETNKAVNGLYCYIKYDMYLI